LLALHYGMMSTHEFHAVQVQAGILLDKPLQLLMVARYSAYGL
jgi:hypothetical protein